MLRSASLGLRHGPRLVGRSSSSSVAASKIGPGSRGLVLSPRQPMSPRPTHWRALSSDSSKGKEKQEESSGSEDDAKEIVLTPGQQVVAASRLGMWAGIFAFGCVCAFYIGRELIPTKMSPNSAFNSASKAVREHPQVIRQYGDKIKFYGKDHGGHREGRRNFIEHTQYQSPDDGTNRTRVRFNLEGQFAAAFCFAEVSSDMPSGEFVYVLVQDKKTGRVITVVDNRASLTAKKLAGGNQDTANAMQQLLGSGQSS
jgi:import inner membrane translocase subunit TIM21